MTEFLFLGQSLLKIFTNAWYNVSEIERYGPCLFWQRILHFSRKSNITISQACLLLFSRFLWPEITDYHRSSCNRKISVWANFFQILLLQWRIRFEVGLSSSPPSQSSLNPCLSLIRINDNTLYFCDCFFEFWQEVASYSLFLA